MLEYIFYLLVVLLQGGQVLTSLRELASSMPSPTYLDYGLSFCQNLIMQVWTKDIHSEKNHFSH